MEMIIIMVLMFLGGFCFAKVVESPQEVVDEEKSRRKG